MDNIMHKYGMGIGKSALIKQMAEKRGIPIIDIKATEPDNFILFTEEENHDRW